MALLLHPLINPVMLKRPLHSRFGSKVLTGIKRTTIRDTAWPLNKPIMLYHWSGKPYASKQQDVAPVTAFRTTPISITHLPGGEMAYALKIPLSALHDDTHPLATPLSDLTLWQLEGFDSRDDMDAWFRAKLKPGQTVHKHLMLFRLLEPAT